MSNVITSITGVFTGIGNWLIGFITQMVPIFYDAETGLTFLGTLAVCGLAIAIFMLIFNVVKSFLSFR